MKKLSGFFGYLIAWGTLALLIGMGIWGLVLIVKAVVKIMRAHSVVP